MSRYSLKVVCVGSIPTPRTMNNYWVKQRDFDSLYYEFTASQTPLTRVGYVKQINALWNAIDPKHRPSLQRRKDKRSLGEFALQVYDCTIREKFLLTEWLKSLGREGVKVEDYGVANDGRLILDENSDRGRPDYRLTSVKGTWKLEVKFCPVQYKLTFKVCDLKSYARADALVLLIMGETRMIGPNGDPNSSKPLAVPEGLRWCLFGRKTIRRMLKELPVKLHKEVGGKPSIQLRGGDIARLLNPKEWNYVEFNRLAN